MRSLLSRWCLNSRYVLFLQIDRKQISSAFFFLSLLQPSPASRRSFLLAPASFFFPHSAKPQLLHILPHKQTNTKYMYVYPTTPPPQVHVYMVRVLPHKSAEIYEEMETDLKTALLRLENRHRCTKTRAGSNTHAIRVYVHSLPPSSFAAVARVDPREGRRTSGKEHTILRKNSFELCLLPSFVLFPSKLPFFSK